ncbi:hypothetical protein AA102526_1851 [Asaia lannensis NBRC 102526]|nr:hypothetical protein AA102526_1851 [Asaia lannensis NBRC 102526]
MTGGTIGGDGKVMTTTDRATTRIERRRRIESGLCRCPVHGGTARTEHERARQDKIWKSGHETFPQKTGMVSTGGGAATQ